MAPRSTNPDSAWLPHKADIHKLYLMENKSQDAVREILAKPPYGLQSTSAEFERVLRDVLHLRKNLKGSEWPVIKALQAKRKRDGKETDVYLDGVLIPFKKVHKETLRHRNKQVAGPDLPAGVILVTPPRSPALAASTLESSSQSLSCLARRTLESQSSLRPAAVQQYNIMPSNSFRYTVLLKNLPWFEFNETLFSPFRQENLATPTTDMDLSSSAKLAINRSIFTSVDGIFGTEAQRTLRHIQSMIPKQWPHQIEQNFQAFGNASTAAAKAIETILCLLSNNLADYETREALFKWIDEARPTTLITILFRQNGPTASQVISKFLENSLIYSNTTTFSFLIDQVVEEKDISGEHGIWLLNRGLRCGSNDKKMVKLLERILSIQPKVVADNELLVLGAIYRGYPNTLDVLLRSGASTGFLVRDPYGVFGCDPPPSILALLYGVHGPSSRICKHLFGRFAGKWPWLDAYNIIFSAHDGPLGLDKVLKDLQTASTNVDALLKKTVDFIITDVKDDMLHLHEIEVHTVMENILSRPDIHSKLTQQEVNSAMAAAGFSTEQLHRLMLKGVHINHKCRCSDGLYPLQNAARFRGLPLVKFLIASGATVNAHLCQFEAESALHFALEAGEWDIADLLIKSGAQLTGFTPGTKSLLEACAKGIDEPNKFSTSILSGEDTFRFLLLAGAELIDRQGIKRKWGMTLKYLISVHCKEDLYDLVLDSGVDVNPEWWHLNPEWWSLNLDQSWSPLHRSIRRQKWDFACKLIRKGADWNIPSHVTDQIPSVLQFACYMYEQEATSFIEYLLSCGTDVNAAASKDETFGFTALQSACKNANVSLSTRLLNAGANVNAPPGRNGGRTALQCACSPDDSISLDLVKLLLDHGADINAPPGRTRGRTALQCACTHHSISLNLVKLLLDHGANINAAACECRGVTALQGAVAKGDLEVVLLLLERGADVAAPGAAQHGRTALEAAAEHGRLDITQILLNAHAAKEVLPKCQKPIKYASRQGHLGIVELLKTVRMDETETDTADVDTDDEIDKETDDYTDDGIDDSIDDEINMGMNLNNEVLDRYGNGPMFIGLRDISLK